MCNLFDLVDIVVVDVVLLVVDIDVDMVCFVGKKIYCCGIGVVFK